MGLLFMKPYCKEVLWGGTLLKERYGYETDGDHTGEAWVVAANPHGESVVINGKYKGCSLTSLWNDHRELFNNIEGDQFPLLVKLIDARDNLSIQVHPDDDYADKYENGSKGKTECWYIVDCESDADIVIGHKAKTKEELTELVKAGKWDELLNVIPIHKGDFFFIPSGTVHAIKKGTLILETQQNSDITYRLYDYDRLQNGKPRELHTEKSLDVIRCPQTNEDTRKEVVSEKGVESQVLAECLLFTVTKYVMDGSHDINIKNDHPFLIVNILEGEGSINGTPIKPGDNFIADCNEHNLAFAGKITFITSNI